MKQQFEISEEYRTGNEVIDEQHVQMLDHMHKADQLFRDENMLFKCADIRKTLENLDSFAARHFATEEEYMREIGYDGCEEHCRQHEVFHRTIREFIDRIPRLSLDTQDEMLRETLVYLEKWWTGHIRTEDKKYADFAKAQKAEE